MRMMERGRGTKRERGREGERKKEERSRYVARRKGGAKCQKEVEDVLEEGKKDRREAREQYT